MSERLPTRAGRVLFSLLAVAAMLTVALTVPGGGRHRGSEGPADARPDRVAFRQKSQ